MSKLRLFACGVAMSALCSAPVSAQQVEDGLRLRPLLGIGFSWGGDTITPVTITPQGSTIQYEEKVKAGSGIDLRAGVELGFARSPYSVQLAVAFQSDGVTGVDNDSLEFRRIPVEAVLHWRATDRFRVGFGVRKALYSTFRTNDATCSEIDEELRYLCGGRVKYKGSVGAIVEAEYMLTPQWGVRARYVAERYKVDKVDEDYVFVPSKEKIRGDHFGLMSVWYPR